MDARAFGKLVFVIIHHFPQISNIAFLFFSKNSLHFENSCYNISWSWACSAAGSVKGSVFCLIYNFISLYSSVPLLELLIWARSSVWESVRFASVRSRVRSPSGPPHSGDLVLRSPEFFHAFRMHDSTHSCPLPDAGSRRTV